MNLPDFDESVRALESRLTMDEMAESHGLLCGLLCARPDLGLAGYKQACQARKLLLTADDEGDAIAGKLLEASRFQMLNDEMAVYLWLPDDDEPLPVRTNSLTAWCSGFLTGLSEAYGDRLMEVSEDLNEIVSDIGEIAQAGTETEDENESEEIAYAEIVEFIRVAVLLVQEELRGPQDHDSVH